MNSFIDPTRRFMGQPPRVGVALGHIDVGKGQEARFQDQLPQILRALAVEARVESIRASTAIEGYDVPAARADALAQPKPARVRNRNEQEFAGYRDALDGLMRQPSQEPLTVPFVLHLHRQMFHHSGGRGGYLKSEDNVIASYDEHGDRHIIFEPPGHTKTETLLQELFSRYNEACDHELAHPVLLVGALVLDFLAIHPVLDGNGRLARLITAHELLRHGYGVVRYISLEQRVFETKNTYYSALQRSQDGWHQAAHDIWPWVEYLTTTLRDAYKDFEARAGSRSDVMGVSMKERTRRHVLALPTGTSVTLAELRRALPGIGDESFRVALRSLRDEDAAIPQGTGRGAKWIRQ